MNTFWQASNCMNARGRKIMRWFLAHNHFIGFIVDLDWAFLRRSGFEGHFLLKFLISNYHDSAKSTFLQGNEAWEL